MGLTIHYSFTAQGSDVQARGLIQALHQTACRFVSSFQALAFAGVPVEQVEHATLAAIDAVSRLHDFFHERNDPTFRNQPLMRTG